MATETEKLERAQAQLEELERKHGKMVELRKSSIDRLVIRSRKVINDYAEYRRDAEEILEKKLAPRDERRKIAKQLAHQAKREHGLRRSIENIINESSDPEKAEEMMEELKGVLDEIYHPDKSEDEMIKPDLSNLEEDESVPLGGGAEEYLASQGVDREVAEGVVKTVEAARAIVFPSEYFDESKPIPDDADVSEISTAFANEAETWIRQIEEDFKDADYDPTVAIKILRDIAATMPRLIGLSELPELAPHRGKIREMKRQTSFILKELKSEDEEDKVGRYHILRMPDAKLLFIREVANRIMRGVDELTKQVVDGEVLTTMEQVELEVEEANLRDAEVWLIASTDVRQVMAAGRQEGFNRQLPRSVVWRMDAARLSIITQAMNHAFKDGKPSDLHFRCCMYIPLLTSPYAVRYFVDIQRDVFDSFAMFNVSDEFVGKLLKKMFHPDDQIQLTFKRTYTGASPEAILEDLVRGRVKQPSNFTLSDFTEFVSLFPSDALLDYDPTKDYFSMASDEEQEKHGHDLAVNLGAAGWATSTVSGARVVISPTGKSWFRIATHADAPAGRKRESLIALNLPEATQDQLAFAIDDALNDIPASFKE